MPLIVSGSAAARAAERTRDHSPSLGGALSFRVWAHRLALEERVDFERSAVPRRQRRRGEAGGEVGWVEEGRVRAHNILELRQPQRLLVELFAVLRGVPRPHSAEVTRRQLVLQAERGQGGEHASARLREGRPLDKEGLPHELGLLVRGERGEGGGVDAGAGEELGHNVRGGGEWVLGG